MTAIAGSVALMLALASAPAGAGAGTRYLSAPFDAAADHTGSGPLATGGPWDPAGVPIGTGSIGNTQPAVISAFVDPAGGLIGTAKGFRLADTNDKSLLLTLYADPVTTAPTTTAPYWISYRFRLDPAAPSGTDALVFASLFGGNGERIFQTSIGKSVDGDLRYKIFNDGGPNVFADLGAWSASDEWRVLIRCDPVSSEHTHWIWKNADTQAAAILGVPHGFFESQTSPLDHVLFQTSWGAPADFVLDETWFGDSGPPAAPSGLRAVPLGSGQVRLSWTDESTDEAVFRIERSETGVGAWTPLTVTAADVESYTDGGLTDGTRYHYRVAAENEVGPSPWAGPVSALTTYVGPPLSDWVDVSEFGADGSDGLDDTAAIQAALDGLAGDWGGATPHVLYFPDGTYLISDPDEDGIGLRLERTDGTGAPSNHHGLLIVGESPGGVVLQWNDSVPGTPADPKVLFHNNGNPRCVWRNLVWDGGGRSAYVVAFDQSSKAVPEGWYDSASAHIDSVFRNAYIGLRIGHFHKQNSELTIRRCRFTNNEAGVSVEDFNALNIWLWDCAFQNNDYGVSNAFGAGGSGDFRVLRGRFFDNAEADVRIGNTGDFTIRECWSWGSKRFLETLLNAASSRTTIIGNRISDIDAADGHAIVLRNAGAFLLVDNRIGSSSPTDRPILAQAPTGPTFPEDYRVSIVALHNKYTVEEPYELSEASGVPCCKLTAFDDPTVPAFSVVVPSLPVANDPLAGRAIYTVTDGDTLQDVIDAALADPSSAAVHLPNGTYFVDETVGLPGSADLIVLGNGRTTTVAWQGANGGTLFDVDGHGAAGLTLRDLRLDGNDAATTIRVRDLNQENSRVLLNRVLVSNASTDSDHAGVVVDRCDRVEVALVGLGLDGDVLQPDGSCSGPRRVGMRVVGGPQPPAGAFVWTGASAANDRNFDIVNGPAGVEVLVSSFYSEKTPHYARVRGPGGAGRVTLHGGKMAALCSTEVDVVSIEDFTGNVGVVNCSMVDGEAEGAKIIQSGGDSALQSVANSVYEDPEYEVDGSTDLMRAGTQLICQQQGMIPLSPLCPDPSAGVGTMPLDDINVTALLLDASVAPLREGSMPLHYDEPGAQATHQINLDNLRIERPLTGVRLEGGIPLTPTLLEATAVNATLVELSWTDGADDEDRFRVERSLTSGAGFVEIGTTPPDQTTYGDTTVSPGTAYFYRVVANRDRTGDSAFSNEASARPAAAGGVPDGSGIAGVPLTVGRNATDPAELDLAWSASCNTEATEYAIYEGTLGDFTGHAPLTCDTGGATQATVEPSGGDRYFLVVPLSGTVEGSYGTDGTGAERARSAEACVVGWDPGGC